jgi:hypothetical protein
VRELKGQIQAKELERSQAATACERLEKELADQATRHAEEIRQLKDAVEHLRAEFESQCLGWSDREKYLSKGYTVIDDLLEGVISPFPNHLPTMIGSRLLISLFLHAEFFPGHARAISEVIEVWRERRRQEGAEIAPDQP